MDAWKVGLGTLLLVISGGIMTATGRIDAPLTLFAAAASPLVVGAGALLVSSVQLRPSA